MTDLPWLWAPLPVACEEDALEEEASPFLSVCRSDVNCGVKGHVRYCSEDRSWTFAPVICTPNVLAVVRMSRGKRSLFSDARKAVAMVTEDKQSLELLLR